MIDNPKDENLKNIQTVLTKHAECSCGGGAKTPHRAGIVGCYREFCPDKDVPEVNDFTLQTRGYGQLKSGEWTRLKSGESNSPMVDTEW